MGTGRGYRWIRSNILGLVAIFIALNGTAAAVEVARNAGGSKPAAAHLAKKKKAKVKTVAGPQGPAGATGPAGPPGVPGPTASAFDQNDPEPNVSISIPKVALDTLGTSSATGTDTHSGPINLTVSSRIQVSAMLDLFSTGMGTASGSCNAHLNGSPDGFGALAFWTIPAAADEEVPLVASIDVPPGSYSIQVDCEGSGGTVTYDNGALNVVAVAL